MSEHSRVQSFVHVDGPVYVITTNVGEKFRVFVCECYSFGAAEYMEVVQNIGEGGAVIISSNWCGYTDEVKLRCRKNGVGVFTIAEFMAALRKSNPSQYLTDAQEERFKEMGWI